MFKYTPNTLKKIENIFKEGDFHIRYEKGTFKSGFCILESKRVVVVNRFFSTEGKINTLLEILPKVDLHISSLTEESKEFMSKFELVS